MEVLAFSLLPNGVNQKQRLEQNITVITAVITAGWLRVIRRDQLTGANSRCCCKEVQLWLM